MAFLSFLDTNLAFFALGAHNLKFSGYTYDDLDLMMLKLTSQMARHMILIDICIFYLSPAG